jgi:hypothetical protein
MRSVGLISLQLPPFHYHLARREGKELILDILRRRYVPLTGEEWVRQHWLHYLINHLDYPKGCMRSECTVAYEGMNKRADIVVRGRRGQPLIVVECKSPEQSITELCIRQVGRYAQALSAPYIVCSNGLSHYCYRLEAAQPAEAIEVLPSFHTLSGA